MFAIANGGVLSLVISLASSVNRTRLVKTMKNQSIYCIFIQCYANKASSHFHPSVDLFKSMIWSYNTLGDGDFIYNRFQLLNYGHISGYVLSSCGISARYMGIILA